MRSNLFGGTIAAAILVSFGVGADEKMPLTGTYGGGFVCEQTNNGAPDGVYTAADLKVVQRDAGAVDAALTFDIPGGGPQTLLFKGTITSGPADNAVSGYLQRCGGSFRATELGRILPTDTGSDDFKLVMDSTFVSTDVPTFEGQLVVATCRHVFQRSHPGTPDIETCD